MDYDSSLVIISAFNTLARGG